MRETIDEKVERVKKEGEEAMEKVNEDLEKLAEMAGVKKEDDGKK
jgi:hypothetical protein